MAVEPAQGREKVPLAVGEEDPPYTPSKAMGQEHSPDEGPFPTEGFSLTDHLHFQTSIQRMIDQLLGTEEGDRQRAIDWLWRHLEALDRRIAAHPERPLSHALILAVAMMPLASRQLNLKDQSIGQSISCLELLVKAVAQRLHVSRKDRERLKQIIFAQRRMLHCGKRMRSSVLMQRDYFDEAWQLFELMFQATGENSDAMSRWQQILGIQKSPGRRKRRHYYHRAPKKNPEG
jgi:hypothetical protein